MSTLLPRKNGSKSYVSAVSKRCARRLSYVSTPVQQTLMKSIKRVRFFSASVLRFSLRVLLDPSEDLRHVARTHASDAHHSDARRSLARMSTDRPRAARGEAGDDEPRLARGGNVGSAPRTPPRRAGLASTSAGDVELREIVVERARVAGETRDDASSPSSSANEDATSASPRRPRGGPPDGGEGDDGDETPGAGDSDRHRAKVGVVREEAGRKKAKRDDDDDDVDFCRICLDSIRREEVESFSSSSFSNANAADGPIGDFSGERGERERGEQPSRGAFHLGCACTGGYMHFSCAALYVAKRCSTDLTCEICLEQMENLRSLRDRRVEARRRANRARVALLVLNGASAEDIRRERRRRRGGDDDDDDEAMRFRVGDARADAFGWGSRNPCVWVLWVLSRPLIAIAWVRRENASPFFLRLSRLVFFFFSPGAFFGFSIFSQPLTRDRPGVRPRCTLRVQNFADALRARVLGHAVLQLVQVLLTFSASLWFFALAAALGYLLFAWRDDFGNGDAPSAYERDATGRETEP